MSTAQRQQVTRWFTVDRWMSCVGCAAGPNHKAIKGHDVPVGTRMRWTRRRDGTATCADCLGLQGIFESGRAEARADV